MDKPVSVQEVIVCTEKRRGVGEYPSPVRPVVQVFTKDGDLIAEKDTFLYQQLNDLAHALRIPAGRDMASVIDAAAVELALAGKIVWPKAT